MEKLLQNMQKKQNQKLKQKKKLSHKKRKLKIKTTMMGSNDQRRKRER